MTDRFDAQLRQHLLENANERPAEGQLDLILEHVDATVQRHPLPARLAWRPARLGRFPFTAIRYGLVAAALVAALAAAVILAGGGPARTVGFEGTWTAIDQPDGSTLFLVVGSGDHPQVHYEDRLATGGACVDDPSKIFTADGTGEISGTRLVATFPNGGGCGSTTVAIALRFDRDPATDTLRGQDGIAWSRVRGGEVGTVPPAPQSATPPASVFEGTWTAVDPGDRSVLTLVVGSGTSPSVHYEDAFASGGACRPDAIKVFIADGTGEITGNGLLATYPDGGGCGTLQVPMGGSYGYRADTDTLVDQDGVIWSRLEDEAPTGEPPSTAEPTPDQPKGFPAFEALPSYTCDLESGTYGGRFGDILVTATTPTTWHGLDDVFHAEDDGCGGGGAVRIEITVVSQVYPDICQWPGTGVDVDTKEADTAAFSEAAQFEAIGPKDTELGGYPARRYELTLPIGFDRGTCDGNALQLWRDPARSEGSGPTVAEPGSLVIYFVDVEDVTLGVYAYKGTDWATPAMRDELDAVVDSLTFEVLAR